MYKNQKDLVSKLLKASSEIHKKTIRGSGNFIITSTQAGEAIHEVMEEGIKRDDREEKLKDLLDEDRQE